MEEMKCRLPEEPDAQEQVQPLPVSLGSEEGEAEEPSSGGQFGRRLSFQQVRTQTRIATTFSNTAAMPLRALQSKRTRRADHSPFHWHDT